MRKTFTLFPRGSVYLCCCLLLFGQARGQTLTPRYIASCQNNPGFFEWLPQGYTTTGKQKWPLLIFLNGSGDFGDGDSTQLRYVLKNGPGRLMNEGAWPDSFTVKGKTFRFIVYMPEWQNVPTLGDLDTMVNFAISHYPNVDTGRVYFAGLSSGGNAVLWYSSASIDRASRLAAIVPMSAGYFWARSAGASVYQQTNMAIFAAANRYDSLIVDTNTIGTINLINAYRPAINPRALDTIWDAVGHDAWTETMDPNMNLHNGMNVYQWMLQYSRDPQDSTPTTAPPDTTKPPPPDTTSPPVTPPDTTTPPVQPPPPPSTPPSGPPPTTPPSTPPISTPPGPVDPPPPPAPPPPAPVQLSSFNAELLSWQPKVGLSWTTSPDANDRYFIVQRSSDSSQQFVNIDTVVATQDSMKGYSYSTIDGSPLVGNNYYRLVMVGENSDSSFPEVRKVIVPKILPESFSLWPNPASGSIQLLLTDLAVGTVEVRVVDVQGRILRVWSYQKVDQMWYQMINVANLNPGSYFIQVIDKNEQLMRAFIKR